MNTWCEVISISHGDANREVWNVSVEWVIPKGRPIGYRGKGQLLVGSL